MRSKIESAKKMISMVDRQYKNPLCYTGFGKDSIVVLHLIKEMGLKWDCMFHRDPYFPKKYAYANKIIEDWDLVCRDFPARFTSVFYMNDTFEVVRHYRIGYDNLVLCAMLYKPEEYVEGQYLCALKDIYLQPRGDIEYIWDAMVEGHRTVEAKPHTAMTPAGLRWQGKHTLGSADVFFPIHDWTNKEVYYYIRDNGIPINDRAYDIVDDELVPKADKTYNPDCRPACYECMLPENPMTVHCPRHGITVNNVWNELTKTVMPNDFPGFHEE